MTKVKLSTTCCGGHSLIHSGIFLYFRTVCDNPGVECYAGNWIRQYIQRTRKMLMIRNMGVWGAKKAVVIVVCVLTPFVFIFLLVRSGSNDPGSCQIFTSREVSKLLVYFVKYLIKF